MANLTHGTSAWVNETPESLDAKSKTYTFATADKYVDKDIALSVTAQTGAAAASGGALSHGDITTTDTTYLTGTSTTDGYKVTMSNTASRAAVTVPVSKAGWIANGEITGLSASGNDTKTKDFYVKKGSASVNASQSISVSGSITNDNGTLTASLSGSQSITGSATAGWITSISSASVYASGTVTASAADLDSNLVAGNIVKGKTIFGVTGTEANATEATFANAATQRSDQTYETYTDISSDAPVLITGDYLYINEGYTTNKKISLAKLVPDAATIVETETGKSNLMYKTISAYDKDGKLIAGTMQDAVVKSGTATVSFTGNDSSGTYNSSTSRYTISDIYVNVTSPTVSTNGYITSDMGTTNRVANNKQSTTITLPRATQQVGGGTLSKGAGDAALYTQGLMTEGTADTANKINLETFETAPTNGYYKLQAAGRGTVNKSAVNQIWINSGWVNNTNSINHLSSQLQASDSATSNYAYATRYVKQSTLSATLVTPSTEEQTVTIEAGYYHADRTITVSAVDASSSSQVAQGALSANDSTISSVTASAGTPTVNTTTWKYSVPLTLSASGTAYAKVSTAGYVTTAKNTSKSLTGSGSATVTLDVYSGSYTVA